MSKEQEKEIEIIPGEEETPEQEPQQKEVDSVADALTSKQLEAKVEKLVNEKLELAQQAQDNEEEPQDEDEEKPKGLGLFPALLIGGVVLVGAATLFIKNRPNSHPTEAQTENQG